MCKRIVKVELNGKWELERAASAPRKVITAARKEILEVAWEVELPLS